MEISTDTVPEPERAGQAGRRTFVNGVADLGETDIDRIELRLGEIIAANVDGEPGDEALAIISCDEYTSPDQVIALKASPTGDLSVLGYALRSPDALSFDIQSIRAENGILLADLLSPPRGDGPQGILDLQTRGYRWSGGAFAQVSGPVAFAGPETDFRKLDLRNTTLSLSLGPVPANESAYARTANGAGEVALDGVRYTVTVLSTTIIEPHYAAGLFRLRGAGRDLTIVRVYDDLINLAIADYGQTITGLDGATKIEGAGGRLRVSVGGQVKVYQRPEGGDWGLVG
jgi:hypothetical protein